MARSWEAALFRPLFAPLRVERGDSGAARLYSPTPMRVAWEAIPEGDLGTSATLARLRQLVDDATRDPLVVQTARRIIAGAGDDQARVEAIASWITSHYRFVKDPVGYELLTAPRRLLEETIQEGFFHGDCDDVVGLAAALAESVGIETRFRVMAPDRGLESQRRGYTHVVIEFFLPRAGWVPVDFTYPEAPLGWAPAAARQAVSRGRTLMAYTQIGYYRPRDASLRPVPAAQSPYFHRARGRRLGQYPILPEPELPGGFPVLTPEQIYGGPVAGAPPPVTAAPVPEAGWLQEIVGGVQQLATTALPFLERYGVLTPERGPYRLPLPGEPSSVYFPYGFFPPGTVQQTVQQWAPLLLLGGGALVLLLMLRR